MSGCSVRGSHSRRREVFAFGRSVAVAAAGAIALLALLLSFADSVGDPAALLRRDAVSASAPEGAAQWASLGPGRDASRPVRRR